MIHAVTWAFKKASAICATTLIALAGANSHAAVITIDGFNTTQGPVIDVVGGGATVSATTAPGDGEPWSNRAVSVTAVGSGIFGGDPAAIVTGGLFGINNDSLESSTVKITWTLNIISGFSVLSGGSLGLDFLNNNPANLTATNVALTIGAATLPAFNLPPIPPGPTNLLIPLSAAQIASLTSGATASLTFNGGDGYDVVLDRVYLEQSVPLPGSITLLGLGLFGLGLGRQLKRAG